MEQLAGNSVALAGEPRIAAILQRVCDLTGMGFAAVARVTEERWTACQVLDRIDFGLDPGDELELKTTICNEIRDHRKAVVFDRASGHAYWRNHPTPVLYGFKAISRCRSPCPTASSSAPSARWIPNRARSRCRVWSRCCATSPINSPRSSNPR
nr:hypothetical protein [Sphingomonas sp. PAMC 26621]